MEQLKLAGLLHDLGKIAIPDTLLQEAGLPEPRRAAARRAHVQFGHSLLEGLGIGRSTSWVRHHHEHWDGSGYPNGLAGEEIPFGSRVILVADAYDAMTSDRTYRTAQHRHAGAGGDPASRRYAVRPGRRERARALHRPRLEDGPHLHAVADSA